MSRTPEWGVIIATFLSVLSGVPRHCARLAYFLDPKSREVNAVLITPQPITCPLRCACGAQEAVPEDTTQSAPRQSLAFEGKGPQRRSQRRLGRRMEGVAEAVGEHLQTLAVL